jgi:hypothetical protein
MAALLMSRFVISAEVAPTISAYVDIVGRLQV